MTKLFSTLFLLLFLVGCTGYKRGDHVELLDGRKAIVKIEHSDGMTISVLILNDKGIPVDSDVIDTLEIKHKVVNMEKE